MARGKLIILEACDGAGKSTQIELIKSYLNNRDLTYKFFHFPMYGDNEFSEVISKFLRGEFGKSSEVNPYFVANIYAMDQFLFLPKLTEYLEKYDVVLLDRYVFSNIVYQSSKYDVISEESNKIKSWITNFQFNFLQMPYPDLSLFLDVPMEILEERLAIRSANDNRTYLNGNKDVHEDDLSLQEKVRYNYIQLFNTSDNCKIVKCTTLSDNSDTVWQLLSPIQVFNSYEPYINDTLNGKT